jgi:hypothetical protein
MENVFAPEMDEVKAPPKSTAPRSAPSSLKSLKSLKMHSPLLRARAAFLIEEGWGIFVAFLNLANFVVRMDFQ